MMRTILVIRSTIALLIIEAELKRLHKIKRMPELKRQLFRIESEFERIVFGDYEDETVLVQYDNIPIYLKVIRSLKKISNDIGMNELDNICVEAEKVLSYLKYLPV